MSIVAAPGIEQPQILEKAEELRQDLAGKSIRGSASLLISEIGCNAFRLVGMIALARLLTPEHFGLISMVTALTAFFEMFKDLGLGTATIQQKEITHQQISTLFWVNTGIGAAIMLLLVAAAPLISWFYGEPRLVWVSIAISSTFLFFGLTVQHQALLRRQMQFVRLAVVQVLATGLSTIIAIWLAWQGFEYWALVWKEISRGIIQASGTWLLCHWLPGLPRRRCGVRSMFQVGSHVTGFNILAFASRNLDQVLLGKFWGAGPVGLYKQAGTLLMLPGSLISFPITYVMTPALSALQNDPEEYRKYYKTVLSVLAFGYMPIIAYLGVYAESVIALLLGGKWTASASILQVLAFASFIETITGTCGLVMITSGRTKAYLQLGVCQAVLLVISFAIGVQWGVLGVAWAYVTYTYITLVPSAWFSFRETPISLGQFFGSFFLPAASSVVMAAILMTIREFLGSSSALAEVGLSLVAAPILYCGVWMLLPGGKQKLVEFLSHARRALETIRSIVCPPTSQCVVTGSQSGS
jgi:O-antigen/teichoic acid export membrane protein